MEFKQIKIGKRYRITHSHHKKFLGQVGEVVELVKKPVHSYVKIKFNNEEIGSFYPTVLASIISTENLNKYCEMRKHLEESIGNELDCAIESIVHLLERDLEVLDFELDFKNNLVHVTGLGFENAFDGCEFPLEYLYKENWYEEMMKEKVRRKQRNS